MEAAPVGNIIVRVAAGELDGAQYVIPSAQCTFDKTDQS